MKNCCKTALRSLSSGDPFTAVYLMIPSSGDSLPRFPYPISAFILYLSHLECGALRVAGVRRPVPGDADVVRLTVAVSVVDTVYRLAVNLQAALRRLEHILECALFVLVKAAAAGLRTIMSAVPIHNNCLLTAAVICIMQTVGYCTIKFCHNKCIPP